MNRRWVAVFVLCSWLRVWLSFRISHFISHRIIRLMLTKLPRTGSIHAYWPLSLSHSFRVYNGPRIFLHLLLSRVVSCINARVPYTTLDLGSETISLLNSTHSQFLHQCSERLTYQHLPQPPLFITPKAFHSRLETRLFKTSYPDKACPPQSNLSRPRLCRPSVNLALLAYVLLPSLQRLLATGHTSPFDYSLTRRSARKS